MDRVVVYYHKDSDTMDIWFANPFMCEEAGEGIILKKDKNSRVIGIEKLYVSKTVGVDRPLRVELVVD